MDKYWVSALTGTIVEGPKRENAGVIGGIMYTLIQNANLIKVLVYGSVAWYAIDVGIVRPRVIAEQRQLFAEATMINDEIRQLKSAQPNFVRLRANLAVRSWSIYPNAEAASLLAEALSSVDHFTLRTWLPGAGAAVSQNGRYVVTFDKREIIVSEIEEHETRLYWRAASDPWRQTLE